MNPELIAGLISGGVALIGAVGTSVWTLVKYKDAKRKEAQAEEKEFYMYTASNIVRESERMFGDGRGEEKKQYAMTRIQNEAVSAGVKWSPKMASLSVEQAVTLRNDYKNMDIPVSEIITKEREVASAKAEELEVEFRESLEGIGKTVTETSDTVLSKVDKKDKEEQEETVISVIED